MLDSPMVSPVSWQEHDGHEQLWSCVPKPGHCRSGGIAAGEEMKKWHPKAEVSQSQGMLELMQVEEEFMEAFLVGLGGLIFGKGGNVPQ